MIKQNIKKNWLTLFVLIIMMLFIGTNIHAEDNVKNENEQKTKGISTKALNSFDITSSVSKNELTSYTDELSINFTIKHNDSTSPLKGGVLVIDFEGLSFELINYAKDSAANSNIQSASFDVSTKKLTVKLKDPISTGSQFDYSVVGRVAPQASHDEKVNAKATLNGKNSSGISYAEETTTTPDVKFNSPGATYVPTNPNDPQWKFDKTASEVSTTYNVYPGGSVNGGMGKTIYRVDGTNETIDNLIIKLEKSSNASGINYDFYSGNNISIGKEVGISDTLYGKRIQDTEFVKEVEYGTVNANIYNRFGVMPTNVSIPKDVGVGTEYKLKFSVYDGTTLLAVHNITIKVIDYKTTIGFSTVASPNEVMEPESSNYDYFDWKQNNIINTAGSGVKDYTVTLNVPEGTLPKFLSAPSNRGDIIMDRVEVLEDGTWKKCATLKGYNYDLSGFTGNVTKLRYVYKKVESFNGLLTYTNLSIRFENRTNMAGSTIPLKVESVTYTDHADVEQSVPNISNHDKSIKAVDNDTKGINQAQANVLASVNRIDPFASILFNGESIYQSVRVGSFKNNLKDPYIYMITPKGLDITSNVDSNMQVVTPYQHGFQVYTLAQFAQPIEYPKSKSDIKYEKFELSDNRTLHFWSIEGLTLKGVSGTSTQVMGGDFAYKINNMQSGTHDVVYGMGSLTDDSYETYTGTPYGGLDFTDTNSDVKSVISKIESNKEYSITKKLTIGINNSVTTKMEIKGSQDSNYIDATSSSATSIPGKEVNYRVSLSNAGTNDLTNFEAIDILPHIGDSLSTNPSQSRGSQFNVNLGSSIKVLVDGVESSDAYLMYSTSNDPKRFDNNGNEIGTGNWSNTPPSDMSTVKAIKVVMPSKPFKIGSTIQLEFTGTLPLDAPRDGKIAYNTVAMKASTTTVTGPGVFVSEPAKGGVKSTEPATDLELSGKVYMDFNKNGVSDSGELGYNGVVLNLYKKNGSNWDKVDTLTSAPDSSSNPGIFGFTGLDNGTYKIEAIKPEDGSFVSVGNNSFEVQSDTNKAWLKYNGNVELSVDDLVVGNPKKITNLAGPFYVETQFKGTIKFVDKNGSIVTSNTYGKDFEIQLQDGSGLSLAGASTTSLADGSFNISNLVTSKANYKLALTKPKSGFVYPSAYNSSDLNTSSGVYSLSDVEPGIGAVADIYISDADNPSIGITKDKEYNPTSITLSASDATTDTSVEYIIKLNGVQVGSGNSTTVNIPTVEGKYTIEAKSIDAALNESTLATETFTIDKTKPNINTTTDTKSAKAGAIKPTDFKTLYGISASDSIDPSVNASKVTVSESVNMNVPGNYPITFKVMDAAGNGQEKTVTFVVEKIEISGIVYDDTNYNSIKDDTGVLKGVGVKLVNNDDDTEVMSTTTDSTGKYEFKIPGNESVTNYAIKVDVKTGYILANKGSDSVVSVSDQKSDSMSVSGVDYLNKHIGMALDVSGSIAPTTLKVYVGDTVSSALSITNGDISSNTINNSNASFAVVAGGYNITGNTSGNSILTVIAKDGYNRDTITLTQNINIIALPTTSANSSTIGMAKGTTTDAGFSHTPTDGIKSYTSSHTAMVTVDENAQLKAINRGSSMVKGKVITNDTEAKEAEGMIIVSVGSQNAPVAGGLAKALPTEMIDAIDFDLTYNEASNPTDTMMKTKGDAYAWSVELATFNEEIPVNKVDYSAIDLSQVPEDGTKIFPVTFSTAAGTSVTVDARVAGKNVIVNPSTGEGISAKKFTIKENEVKNLNNSKVISLASAKAWNLADGSVVDIVSVDYSNVKAKAGTYKATFATAKGTTITVDVVVTGEKVEDIEEDENDKPKPIPKGGNYSIAIALLLIGFSGITYSLTRRRVN